jgi:small conductance mechanosensitive channel
MTWKHLWITLLFAAVGAPATGAPAQQNGVLAVEADSAMAKLDRTRAELRDLTSRLETRSGEDSVVTYRRRATMLVAALSDIQKMADLLVRQEKGGGDASRLRDYLDDLLPRVPEALAFARSDLKAQLVAAENKARHADPAELGVISTDISELNEQLDGVYDASAKYVAILEQTGGDVTPARNELVASITQRAELLEGKLRLAMEERQKYARRVSKRTDDTRARELADAAQGSIDNQVASLDRISTTMKRLGLDVTEYRTLLVEATGELSRGLGDRKVALNLLQSGLARLRDWALQQAPSLILKLILFAVVLFAFNLLARVVRKTVLRSMDSSRVKASQLMRNMVGSAAKNIVMILGVLVALSQLGLSLGPLLAGLGLAGFIVGFALQETLSNFASGVMILFYQPFDVGDAVEAGGVLGTVSHMSIVSTTILTFDNQTLIVPNRKIWGDVIKNINTQNRRRVDLTFGISYRDDIPRAEAVLMEIVKAHPKVLENPEPVVRLHQLADSSVNFIVRPWVMTADYWEVYWDVTRTVKMRFDQEGISIPFPQRDVHVYQESAEGSA